MSIFIEPLFQEYYAKFPLVLVDVGASGGFSPNWKPASKYLQVIGFEPDEREYTNLKQKNDGKVKYLNTFLYSEASKIKFYLNRKQTTSSMFKPNRNFIDQFPEAERFDTLGEVEIMTDTLDHQFKINGITNADFIKIDTEGSELFILQGAVDTLKQDIFGLEVEVEYAPMHKGQPQFSDVDSFLQKHDFHLFDLCNYYWKRSKGIRLGKIRGQVIFGDALYFKTPDAVVSMVNTLKGDAAKVKVLKAVSISALYGYFDYAMEIFERLKHHFSPSEQEFIQRWISRHVGPACMIPSFPGKSTLSRALYRLSDVFKNTYHGWGTVERKLGNR